MIFKDRKDAGEKLAKELAWYKSHDAVVYALPRGGVILGSIISKKLHLPLDIIVTRKVGHPNNPEYALAAVCENSDIAVNKEEIKYIDKKWFKNEIKKKRVEAQERRKLYTGERKPISAKGKIAIIVDDGVAAGLTLKVAILEIRHQKPLKLINAVPVISKEVWADLVDEADRIVTLYVPSVFTGAVGSYYEDFSEISDDEVLSYLDNASGV